MTEPFPRRLTIVQTISRHAADTTTDSSSGGLAEIIPLSARHATVARRAFLDVDVVIASHRCPDGVLACLDSLADAADGWVRSVTVVDNGSNDGTCEVVAARRDGIRVLDMGMNTGTATAFNAGMARGLGQYVLVLDPATVLTPGSLRTLVEFADRHPEAGVVAPRLLTGEVSTAGTDLSDDPAVELDRVSGQVMLVPRSVHATTAGFDEDYFSFWADRDWCRRIKAAGYSIWCVPTATAVHKCTRPAARSERRAVIRSFYAGAYRYWLRHDAPSRLHPWRWIRAFLLMARGALAMGSSKGLPPTCVC